MPSVPPGPLRLAVTALAAAALAACSSVDGGPVGGSGGSDAAEATPTPTCTPAPLAERAGAVLMVGLTGVTEPDDPLVGQVLDAGVSGIFINHDNVEGEEQLRELVQGVRARAGRPISVSTDEESGRVAVTRDVVGAGPSPRRLAARRTPAEVREFAAGIGETLAGLGIDVDLAPLLDLDDGPSGGIVGDRSFSADPGTAAEYGLAFSRGLADAGVRPTVKHFPGQGRSTTDTHAEADVVEATLEDLRTTDLAPFQAAVDAGVPVVMLNHLGYEALDGELPASLSPKAYALLREMGFEGVAMTDSLGMGAVNLRWDFPEAAVRAIEAGADVALATDGNKAVVMRDAIVAAVESGRLPEDRLDEAAARATALAGGDPQELTCRDAALPQLAEDPATAGTATPTAGSTATPSGSATPSATPSATTQP